MKYLKDIDNDDCDNNNHNKDLESFFLPPEKTDAKTNFADIPIPISFNEAEVIVYGIPLDITTSFGKGTARGPEAIRKTSAEQIETLIFEDNVDIYEKIKIFDLGDLIIPKNNNINKKLDYIDKILIKINRIIRREDEENKKKIPIILGGEHTISYYSIKSIMADNDDEDEDEKPVIIHFDAHRDMKKNYQNLDFCHTTPFYHLINDGHIQGKDLVQIGIRQADKEENLFAKKTNTITFDAWNIYQDISNLKRFLKKFTNNRKVYISFDIDVLDIAYVPCTGTPEPFGLNPFQIYEIINSISNNSQLIGMDIVEVGLKNNDYREGTLATHIIYRILNKFA